MESMQGEGADFIAVVGGGKFFYYVYTRVHVLDLCLSLNNIFIYLGIAGFGAALALQQAGYRVQVFEKVRYLYSSFEALNM